MNTNTKSDMAIAKKLSKEGKARLEYQDRIKKAWAQADAELYRRERGLLEKSESKR